MGVAGRLGLNQTGAERLALMVFVGEEFGIGGCMGLCLHQTRAGILALRVFVGG